MDHKAQIRQVQTARGNVGGDTDAGPAITQGLQGIGPLALGQFARQGDDLKAALTQAGIEPTDIFAGRTEDQSARRIDVTQHIDHRPFDLIGGAADDTIFDIAMGFVQAGRIDPHRIALIAAREGGDIFCNGGREQQGPALDRRGIQNEFQIIAKAEIEHLVGLVQHGDLQGRQVQMAALNMVAQTAGGADNNVGPVAEQTLLAPRIHAADARDDDRASLAIEPGQFAADLNSQFTGRSNGQAQGRARLAHPLSIAQQGRGGGEAEGNGLTRTGLGRNKKILVDGPRFKDSCLHRSGVLITLLNECALQRGMGSGKGHKGPD